MEAFATHHKTGVYKVAFEREEERGDINTVHFDFTFPVGEDSGGIRQLAGEVLNQLASNTDHYFYGRLHALLEDLGTQDEEKRLP